jgi:hypothetical protein
LKSKIKALTTIKHLLKTLITYDATLISAKTASEIFWLYYISHKLDATPINMMRSEEANE